MDRSSALERAAKAASRSAKIGAGVVGAHADTARSRTTNRVGDTVGGAVTRVLALTLLVTSVVSIAWKVFTFRRAREQSSKA